MLLLYAIISKIKLTTIYALYFYASKFLLKMALTNLLKTKFKNAFDFKLRCNFSQFLRKPCKIYKS